ncbi:MAG: phosphoribosylaminoimidazolesuccinocarboxamide synthase [Promethearchaeota archaeon]
MNFERLVLDNIENTVEETDFPNLGKKYRGKVRDNYITNDGRRVIIATDRLSAFDRVITTIPFKGQLLNQLSNFWFQTVKDVPTHLISVPDPNVTVVKQCEPYPVEMVVRAYITGSAWRAYEKGQDVSGIEFPAGLRKNQRLDEVVITPSTKAEVGIHDEAISREEILKRGLVPREEYEMMEEYTMKLFAAGSKLCDEHGLILVDTKYEFGKDADGNIVVIDEIHTPDSSRFWIKDTYEALFSQGKEPDILDKEFFRGWLMSEKNYMGDGPVPQVPPEIKVQLAKRYKESYETITGRPFEPALEGGSVKERIEKNLRSAGLL